MSHNIKRIKVSPNDFEGSYVNFDLEKDISYLQVLSLNINQEDLYQLYDSPYGVLAGRVVANGGFGVPNAKISIFIPLSPEDESDSNISRLYPYKTINDRDSDGYRYNLLPSKRETAQDTCYSPTGTMPVINDMLNDNVLLEIHDKYYKFTTSTNDAGDYMIMGIPTGNQQIHVDVDLSDIGFLSQKPAELIAQGVNENLFESYVKFNTSSDLDSLPQIQTINTAKEIYPLWGQGETVGINRLDLKLPVNITPTAYIMFGNFTDSSRGTLSRSCRPRKRTGRNCELTTSEGEVTIIRRVNQNGNEIEVIQNSNNQIDENGNSVFAIPLNLERRITDEFGNLVPSIDPNIGIPTSAKIRMKVNLSDSINGARKRTANYLIPNLYNDFRFGDDTLDRDFFEIKWKKIYTVSNYIPRYQPNKQQGNDNFTGLKKIGQCESNLSIPYNRIRGEFSIIYTVFCIILGGIISIFDVVTDIIGFLTFGIIDFEFPCPDGTTRDDARDWKNECILPELAEFFNVIEYEFYNDFLTGSLYHMKYRFKFRFKRSREALYYRYCAFNCRDYVPQDNPNYINRCRNRHIVDYDIFDSSPSYFEDAEATKEDVNRGLIVEYNGEFFYAARSDMPINFDDASELNLDTSATQKNLFLFATTFKELGSSVVCDIEAIPFLVTDLVPSTFQESDDFSYLVDLSGLSSCFDPDNIESERVYKICQFGVDLLGGREDEFNDGEFYLDSENQIARKYLCESFNLFSNINTHSINSTTTVYDADSNSLNPNDPNNVSYEIIDDQCDSISNSEPIRNITPYFHYFGLIDGKTSLDKAKNSFLAIC